MSLLREHQERGAQWLAKHPRGYLGDAPRVGKCRTLLRGAQLIGARRPLVICPAIVRTHWKREAALLGVSLDLVYSYEAIQRGGNALMAEIIGRHKPDVLIGDEWHYLKHAASKRTQQIMGKDGYARRFDVCWPASGTPFPKNIGEFWTTLASVFPERAHDFGFKTREQFEEHFLIKVPRFMRGQVRMKVIGQRHAEDFKRLIEPIMLRRTLRDVSDDVPELDFQMLRINAAHPKFVDTVTAGIVNAAIELGTLANIENDPHVASLRRRLGELKAEAILPLLRDALTEGEEKIVVFAHHRTALETLREGLADFGVAFVDGRTSNRDAEIDRFQQDPSCRVFVGQNIACMTGVTLDAAETAFLVEPDWTAVVNEQLGNRVMNTRATGRRAVAQMVALAGTLDEAIVGQNRNEVRMVNEILT